jgi:hypothetical protein
MMVLILSLLEVSELPARWTMQFTPDGPRTAAYHTAAAASSWLRRRAPYIHTDVALHPSVRSSFFLLAFTLCVVRHPPAVAHEWLHVDPSPAPLPTAQRRARRAGRPGRAESLLYIHGTYVPQLPKSRVVPEFPAILPTRRICFLSKCRRHEEEIERLRVSLACRVRRPSAFSAVC